MSARIELIGMSKAFPGVQALDNVDFAVEAGEVHALLGENGAGKSTLIKVLTGAMRSDAGVIRLDGKPIHPDSPGAARAAGICCVYQEVNLIPTMSVTKNLTLGRLPRRFGMVDWPAARKLARQRLAKLGLDIDVERPLGHYSVAIQQLVAIARVARGRRASAGARRADGEPRRPRDAKAVRHCARPEEARSGDHLHHPFHRSGLSDRRSDHRAAQRPPGRHRRDRRNSHAQARVDDDWA